MDFGKKYDWLQMVMSLGIEQWAWTMNIWHIVTLITSGHVTGIWPMGLNDEHLKLTTLGLDTNPGHGTSVTDPYPILHRTFTIYLSTTSMSSQCSHVHVVIHATSTISYTQRKVQPDQCYFTVQITDINFECSL